MHISASMFQTQPNVLGYPY